MAAPPYYTLMLQPNCKIKQNIGDTSPPKKCAQCQPSHASCSLWDRALPLVLVLTLSPACPLKHPNHKIKARWLKMNNARLTEDRVTATKTRRDKGFADLATNTWEKVLRKNRDAPND
jgi:hypothetical protein